MAWGSMGLPLAYLPHKVNIYTGLATQDTQIVHLGNAGCLLGLSLYWGSNNAGTAEHVLFQGLWNLSSLTSLVCICMTNLHLWVTSSYIMIIKQELEQKALLLLGFQFCLLIAVGRKQCRQHLREM